jgi:hypothetical protein
MGFSGRNKPILMEITPEMGSQGVFLVNKVIKMYG